MRTVLFGMPRSGTTYGFSLLSEALKARGEVQEVFEPNSLTQGTFRRMDGLVWPDSESSLVKILYSSPEMHGWSGHEAADAFAHYDKKIFLVRDPRDRWISGFFYRWFYVHDPNPAEFTLAHRKVRDKEGNPDSIPFYRLHSDDSRELAEHAAQQKAKLDELSALLDRLRREGWFIWHYEDLVDRRWTAVEDYLGIPLLGESALRNNFRHVARSQVHSDWRRWFNDADVEFYRPVFQDYLAAQGYDPEDWKLEYPSSLPASQGSDYMLGLFRHPNGPHAVPVPPIKKLVAWARTRISLLLKDLGLKKR
jgi:hypothetical protein